MKDREIVRGGRVYIVSNGRVFDKKKLYKLPFYRSTKEWLAKKLKEEV